MSFFGKIFGSAASDPIKAIGGIIDKLFTSEGEKLDKKIILERLAQQPGLAQTELNKIHAQHKSIFVSGWIPYIGWVCGSGLMFVVIINPLLGWVCNRPGPQVPEKLILDLIYALLGLATVKTYETIKGRAK